MAGAVQAVSAVLSRLPAAKNAVLKKYTGVRF
jgi:hypothetical protein